MFFLLSRIFSPCENGVDSGWFLSFCDLDIRETILGALRRKAPPPLGQIYVELYVKNYVSYNFVKRQWILIP